LQTPIVEPDGRMQIAPGQQSPLMVHEPSRGTQSGPPQRRTPCASGTQGAMSQQSACEAHVSPIGRQSSPMPLQRGTPSASSWQPSRLAPSAPQQLARALEMLHA
jgi:hypothetical protein